jgi:ABC-type multidrug transport system ATPase subunit
MDSIVLEGLTRRFGESVAVDNLSFSVGAGELFGLVGPDGSGKTTTLRMLAGILRPSDGDALVGGSSVSEDPEAVKHHIAYMSQRFGLYTDLTVRENIDFYADIYGVPMANRPERLERLYAFSNLGPFEHRLAGQLSGGMKQKLSLCCALIHHPHVMLLDEPTFGVDPISRRDLWLIIHQMVAEGTTVLVSTAYMDEAERCDRIALLNGGRILALDTPENVQASAQDIIHLLTDFPRMARDRLRALDSVQTAHLFGESIHVSMEEGTSWDEIEQVLVSAGIEVLSQETRRPSLEDVFIRRVREDDAA